MFGRIEEYLERYRSLLQVRDISKKRIAEILSIELRVSIGADDISYSGKNLIIKGESTIKHKIFTLKNILLQKIQKEFPNVKDLS